MLAHHTRRGTDDPAEQLLRDRDGTPITTRRYDHLWHRIGTHLPWVAQQGITTHWLRHTTLTWVERHYGSTGGFGEGNTGRAVLPEGVHHGRIDPEPGGVAHCHTFQVRCRNDRMASSLRDHVDTGFTEMRGKLDAAATGQQQIVDLLTTLDQ